MNRFSLKPYRRVAVCVDRKVLKHPATRKLLSAFARETDVVVIPLRAGESLKTLQRIFPLYGRILRSGLDRRSALVAIGGGATGDAVGFVAATFMRGVDWFNVPTTLLSQVDAAIGGKTAINHPMGKNLIGSFHAPRAIHYDSSFLATLSRRELRSGLFEMIKYGFLLDPAFLRAVTRNLKALERGDGRAFAPLIRRCVSWKTRIVRRDPRDLSGVRELLNFGHTYGHALESATRLKHGEAVGHGMKFALGMSRLKLGLADRDYRTGMAALQAIGLEKAGLPRAPEKLWKRMLLDKKTVGGEVRMVLLKKLGEPRARVAVTREDFERVLRSGDADER